MRRILTFLTIISIGSPHVMATDTGKAHTEHRSLWTTLDRGAMMNPAVHGGLFHSSYSELMLSMARRRETEAFVLENGDGSNDYGMTVNTFLRLSDRTAVWGEAGYTSGQRMNVTWCSTSDYALLKPYVLADTLGGNTEGERYTFSGGYATRIDRISIGGEMTFRAEQEYRDTDPRMRGIVTDLTLRGGAALALSGYSLGASLEANIYKQTNSVSFYDEDGVIPEYQMTGLGTEYARFSGDKRSIYYDGGGARLMLNLAPDKGKGVYADCNLSRRHYERKLADYNALPLTKLYVEGIDANVGWRHKGAGRMAIYGQAKYTRKTGDENVCGDSYGGSYPVIATLTMYHDKELTTAVGAMYGRGKWNAMLRGGYRSEDEEYVYPERRMKTSHAFGTMDVQWLDLNVSPLRLSIDAHAAYSSCLTHKVVMPYANMKEAFTTMIRHKADYAKADYTTLSAKVRADYALHDQPLGLFAEAGGTYTHCTTGERMWGVSLSVGMVF